MLLQDFTKHSRNFFRKLSLKKHFLIYYGKVWKTFLRKVFFNWNCKRIFPKPCKNISQKVIRKPIKKIFCIIAWNITRRFQKEFLEIFLWNWKCKKIFPKPCKNISRKVIRKPFKKIFCIIAWNVLATFLQRFGHGIDIWNRILRNVIARN